MADTDGEHIEFVCLANSRKKGGRAVAGLRLYGEGWVRLVGSGDNGALSAADCSYEDGARVALLDVVSVPVISASPELHHPEDFLIDETAWWTKERAAGEDDFALIRTAIRRGGLLLGNDANKVPYSELERKPVVSSLALIEPQDLIFRVVRRPLGTNLQARAGFRFGEVAYDLPVTDVAWEETLKALGKGDHSPATAGIGDDKRILLTVTLGDPNVGHCYKLVAGLVALDASVGVRNNAGPLSPGGPSGLTAMSSLAYFLAPASPAGAGAGIFRLF